MTQPQNKRVVIACRMIEFELEQARDSAGEVEIRYLDEELHRTPQKLRSGIQEQIRRCEAPDVDIVLGYGRCSDGSVGVSAGQGRLILPRCDDCIGLFFETAAAYARELKERPGRFYLPPGWLSRRRDPLGIVENVYTPRVGRETAEWSMQEELKHYTHMALIDTGGPIPQAFREIARENARFFGKRYIEIEGSTRVFRELLGGIGPKGGLAVLGPRQPVGASTFETPGPRPPCRPKTQQ